ncbi:MAG: dihydrofolate reductase family protein [Bacteroidales bacterium]|nr:dihydrofolate reductase family protein [Bacteroidales bacterium]
MIPKVIVHNSISLDGSLTGFNVNMPLHYQIAGGFQADMHLVGSNTAKTGMDMFLDKIPEEREEDLRKPDKAGILWSIPDSTGKLKGLLHVFRQSEYCRDVVIFISQSTPDEYIKYLKERDYDHYVAGKNKCDLKMGLEILDKSYHVKKVLTDTGCILSNILIEQGLVSEISMLVHPTIVGKKCYNMFGNIKYNMKPILKKKEFLEGEYIWLVFEPPEGIFWTDSKE